jgi:hypothetical protein
MEANEAAQEKTHRMISALALRGEITRGASIDRKLMLSSPFLSDFRVAISETLRLHAKL